MECCPHCKGILIGTLGGYFHCHSQGCMKLLWPVDPKERESEEEKKKLPLAEGE